MKKILGPFHIKTIFCNSAHFSSQLLVIAGTSECRKKFIRHLGPDAGRHTAKCCESAAGSVRAGSPHDSLLFTVCSL